MVIVSRGEPLARILPIPESISEHDRRLAAAGILKLPEKRVRNWKKFWEKFFAMPGADLNPKKAAKAVLDEREESW